MASSLSNIVDNLAEEIFKTKCKYRMVTKNVKIYSAVCFYHVTYAFQSESTLYSCLNVKELLARSRREI